MWNLRHQTAAPHSAVEYTRARVAVRRTKAHAPQVVSASRPINETLVRSFLRLYARSFGIDTPILDYVNLAVVVVSFISTP